LRILVTGDRNWRNAERVRDCLYDVARNDTIDDDGCYQDLTLVEGEAMGADIYARVVVELEIADWDGYYPRWVAIDPFPADWKQFGPAAGPIRNTQMQKSGVDFVVGFHNDIASSRGTKDMLKQCAKAGIPGRLFTEEGEVDGWENLVLPATRSS